MTINIELSRGRLKISDMAWDSLLIERVKEEDEEGYDLTVVGGDGESVTIWLTYYAFEALRQLLPLLPMSDE